MSDCRHFQVILCGQKQDDGTYRSFYRCERCKAKFETDLKPHVIECGCGNYYVNGDECGECDTNVGERVQLTLDGISRMKDELPKNATWGVICRDYFRRVRQAHSNLEEGEVIRTTKTHIEVLWADMTTSFVPHYAVRVTKRVGVAPTVSWAYDSPAEDFEDFGGPGGPPPSDDTPPWKAGGGI